ncbi:MAG TPA: cytochrome c, partial [Myxococcales bacterium]|nr:cytochrome c [Myxococcales bacterium]
FPRQRIDLARAERGRRTWEAECADCHALGGKRVGQVTPLAEVGTDPERLASFNEALVAKMNTIGTGYPWRFNHFKRTGGYANAPLDGVWLRSPYLHNGSVPTLRALLFPDERTEVFFRGHDAYDWDRVGYVSEGPDAEKAGFRFDTRLRGNSSVGHLYGTTLPAAEREDLLEYMKTL